MALKKSLDTGFVLLLVASFQEGAIKRLIAPSVLSQTHGYKTTQAIEILRG